MSTAPASVMIIAGEASGDLHSAGLLREFQKLHPKIRFFGVAGEKMRAAGCEAIFRVEDVSFLGLAEVIRHLPFIRRMMRTLLQECEKRQPVAVVLVDYPGFNLRFAERLRKNPVLRRTPILYYVSPQVWAWHSSRVPQIARLVDQMAVIFDFEVPIYEAVGLKTDFVGHPLLEVVQPTQSREDFRRELGIDASAPLLALLPGSRAQEVRRLLPVFTETFLLLKNRIANLKAGVACSPTLAENLYRDLLKDKALLDGELQLWRGRTYDLVSSSDVALVASGTATLETAILGTPLVMAYRVAPLTYWIGRRLVKIPNIALVNVVARKRIAPEFVQGEAEPKRLAEELENLLTDSNRRASMIAELSAVRQKLGEPGASRKTAEILHTMISAQNGHA
ncbi:MAG: lipid-A-disaccharide synthase [bacterium]